MVVSQSFHEIDPVNGYGLLTMSVLRLPFAVLALCICLTACRTSQPVSSPPDVKTEPVAPTDAAAAAPAPTPDAALVAKRGTHGPNPDVCADCHPDYVDGFAATGMGHSLYRPTDRPPIEDFTPAKATVVHPLSKRRYRAYIDESGKWWQEESFADTDYRRRVEVEYVVGSGNHTRSYLGTVEGELIQLPLTWYSARRIWDMSPGYDPKNHFRFNRPVKPMCIFCHNDLTPARDDTLAGYTEPLRLGITCARCHGDGSAHVEARSAGKSPPAGQPDPHIFNPKHESQQTQLRLCQQCHLTGEARVLRPGQRWDTYDPRTPLDEYLSIYSYAQDGGAEFGIASHGSRLALSRCAQEAGDQMTCTRCHDPHRKDTTKSHRAACLECHQVEDCGDGHGVKPNANCAGCHMHRGDTSDIPHVTFTDHFIRKRPSTESTPPRPDSTALVDALGPPRGAEDVADAAVRLGMAHARVARFNGTTKHRPEAIKQLIQSLKDKPERPQAWFELGVALAQEGDFAGALAAFASLETLEPEGVLYRINYADAFQSTGDLAGAEKQLRKAIAIRPDYRIAWGNLANVLQHQKRHQEAEAAYAKADALAPHIALTAHNRGYNALGMGDAAAARRWFEEGIRRDPTTPAGFFNLATLALKQRDFATARQHFDTVLVRDPGFVNARWLRGRLNLEQGKHQAARQDFEAMVRLVPKNPNGYLELARLELAVENFGGARTALQRGRVAIPGHPLIERAMVRLIRGEPL